MNGALGAGSELAGYRVTGLLGRGGMGFVYEAEHQLLKRKAALKTLAPELGGGSDFRERFIRESQTVASIDHPNIIPIYDAGDVEGMVYIAMRYVKGPDLEKLIASGGTADPHEALSILEQVAGALDAAHAHDVIHRDVKPPNVMIEDGSGRIYLMDFGIAKQGGDARAHAGRRLRRHGRLRRAGADRGEGDHRRRRRLRVRRRPLRGAHGQEAVRARHRRGGDVRAHHRAAAEGVRRRAPSCRRRSTP